MYARNYSNFSSKDFHDDVSIQKWNYELNNSTELFSDCVDIHDPNLILETLSAMSNHG